WYLGDRLGTVRYVANTAGTVLDHVVYDSFGNIVTETNASNGDRFKFAGMEYDSAVGRYYDRARAYDPGPGRFLTQDPVGFAAGDTNLYRYVGNEPTQAIDPTGKGQMTLGGGTLVFNPPSTLTAEWPFPGMFGAYPSVFFGLSPTAPKSEGALNLQMGPT